MAVETSVTLLRKLSSGEEDAWRVFLERYQPFLLGYFRRFGLQEADAEDLVQILLLVLRQKLPEFSRERMGSFRNWLRTVMWHRALEHARKKNRAKFQPLEQLEVELADGHSDLSRQWNEEHQAFLLERVMRDLKPNFAPQTWEAFERVTSGESADSVAAALGMKVGSVRVAKSRITSALREAVAEFE